MHIQKGDLKALPFELLQGVQDGMVFKGSGDDMPLAPLQPKLCGGEEGLVVRLAAAGGEYKLPGVGPDTGGDALSGLCQGLGGLLTGGVEAGGIAIDPVQKGEHGVNGGGTHFGGCGVVCIDFHR